MDILVGGISKELLERKIKPLFKEEGYSRIKFHQANEIKHSKEIISSLSKLDLMILGGYESSGYNDFYQLARNNPKIPSILTIANCHQGVMNQFANIHPPSYTCYFQEFEHLDKKRIDYILSRNNLYWGSSLFSP